MLQRIADKCRELKDHDPNREMFEYMKLYAANHRMWEKGIKEYVYCDSMSFKPKAEQWDIGNDESAYCKKVGDHLLEVIDRSRHRERIKKEINNMFNIIHVSEEIWCLNSVKILFYTGFHIFNIVLHDEVELRESTHEVLEKLLLWIFSNKDAFYGVYETEYNSCVNATERVGPALTANFRIGPLTINIG